jgi:large subunit ribosomal protein L4
VIPEADKNVVLSGRNLPKTKITLASDINTYDLLNAEKLILCEGSIEKIENILN